MKPKRIVTTERIAWLRVSRGWLWIPALLAALTMANGGAAPGHAQSPAPPASASDKAASPKAGAQTKPQAPAQPVKPKTAGATASTDANTVLEQRRQQINNECTDLLKMATSLKAQVDKTTKDELSVAVVRQADQIEKLARTVKDEMQPVVKKPGGKP